MTSEKTKTKREFLGFQIASADYSDMPSDYPSFEVLSAATVDEFFRRVGQDVIKAKGWLVHPVYEGDIKEPFFNDKPPKAWPKTVKHAGRTWSFTGKTGKDAKTGAPAAEYEDANSGRVWLNRDGTIEAE